MKIDYEDMYSFDQMLIGLRFEDKHMIYVWKNYNPSRIEIVRSWDALNKIVKRKEE